MEFSPRALWRSWYTDCRSPRLHLEPLEERTVLSTTANEVFISSLYQGLLAHTASSAGLTYWSGQLNAGLSRTQVALGIATSAEALDYDVEQFYQILLDRPADEVGLNYWIGELNAGASLDQVKAGILGSDEFFQLSGNTNEGFLNALYVHELGRPVDAVGLVYWEQQLNDRMPRTQVASEVLASPEALKVKLTSFYEDVLGRAPDPAGVAFWSAPLAAGVSDAAVLAGILGSNEYFGHVQQAAGALTSDPDQAAAAMIASLELFGGPLPNADYLAQAAAAVPTAPTGLVSSLQGLTVAELQPAIQAAIAAWANVGLDQADVQKLEQAAASIQIASLNQPMAETVGSQITLDFTAQGLGWYIDPTPSSNANFPTQTANGLAALSGSPAAQGVDLVTVLAHEFAHVIGLPDQTTQPNDLMYEYLGVGLRRLPTVEDVSLVQAYAS